MWRRQPEERLGGAVSPRVRPNTFAVLEELDARDLTNPVLVITRHQRNEYDIDLLNQPCYLGVTLFTYSGIDTSCPA